MNQLKSLPIKPIEPRLIIEQIPTMKKNVRNTLRIQPVIWNHLLPRCKLAVHLFKPLDIELKRLNQLASQLYLFCGASLCKLTS